MQECILSEVEQAGQKILQKKEKNFDNRDVYMSLCSLPCSVNGLTSQFIFFSRDLISQHHLTLKFPIMRSVWRYDLFGLYQNE